MQSQRNKQDHSQECAEKCRQNSLTGPTLLEISGKATYLNRPEARSLDTIGLASAKGICHHQLSFINC
jgi:hypothetical protein